MFKVYCYATIKISMAGIKNIMCAKVSRLVITWDCAQLCREMTCFGSVALPALPRKVVPEYRVDSRVMHLADNCLAEEVRYFEAVLWCD